MDKDEGKKRLLEINEEMKIINNKIWELRRDFDELQEEYDSIKIYINMDLLDELSMYLKNEVRKCKKV